MAANNMRELIALAKASPGKLTFGSSGTGAASHLAAELFKSHEDQAKWSRLMKQAGIMLE